MQSISICCNARLTCAHTFECEQHCIEFSLGTFQMDISFLLNTQVITAKNRALLASEENQPLHNYITIWRLHPSVILFCVNLNRQSFLLLLFPADRTIALANHVQLFHQPGSFHITIYIAIASKIIIKNLRIFNIENLINDPLLCRFLAHPFYWQN